MNRNQIFIMIGLALLLAGIAVAAWIAIAYFGPQNASVPDTDATLPASDPFGSITIPSTAGEGTLMNLTGTDGTMISVPDFTKGKDPIEFNGERYYFLYGPEYSTEGFTFSVQYLAGDSSFLIELLAEPLQDARADAEGYLSELLRRSGPELCSVRTKVVVNDSVNELYSRYENLCLTGCDASGPLP